MSNFAITWAMSQETGSPTSKLILLKLADQANDDGKCWPSQKTMATHCEVNRATINRHIKKLAEAGLLEIIPRSQDGVSLPNIYRLKLTAQGLSAEIGVGAHDHRGGRTESQGVGAHDHTNHQLQPSLNPQDDSARADHESQFENERLHPPGGLPDAVAADTWESFVSHRKAIKKPMTGEAKRLLVNKLARMADDGHDVEQALENSIINGWQGVFEPDEKRSNGNGPTNSGHHGGRKKSSAEGFWEHFGTEAVGHG